MRDRELRTTVESERPSLYGNILRHVESEFSGLIALLWGLAEATLFFIVPDVYLGFVALISWRRSLTVVLAAVVGALIGGALMYTLATRDLAQVTAWLLRVPGIDAQMVQTVDDQLRHSGLAALVSGPWAGIPYKVYAVEAGGQHLPLRDFLLLSIPARLERLLPITLLSALVGAVLKPLIRRQSALFLAAYVLLWIAVYALYYAWLR